MKLVWYLHGINRQARPRPKFCFDLDIPSYVDEYDCVPHSGTDIWNVSSSGVPLSNVKMESKPWYSIDFCLTLWKPFGAKNRPLNEVLMHSAYVLRSCEVWACSNYTGPLLLGFPLLAALLGGGVRCVPSSRAGYHSAPCVKYFHHLYSNFPAIVSIVSRGLHFDFDRRDYCLLCAFQDVISIAGALR